MKTLTIKAAVRLTGLTIAAKANRAVNSVVEVMASAIENANHATFQALDDKQDAVYVLYSQEARRIRQEGVDEKIILARRLETVDDRVAAKLSRLHHLTEI